MTRQVLELLEKNKLYLRPDKCEFERTTVEYSAMVVIFIYQYMAVA